MLVFIRFLPFATRLTYPLMGRELHSVCGGGGYRGKGRMNYVGGSLPFSLINMMKSWLQGIWESIEAAKRAPWVEELRVCHNLHGWVI